jgi:hypothetical protein
MQPACRRRGRASIHGPSTSACDPDARSAPSRRSRRSRRNASVAMATFFHTLSSTEFQGLVVATPTAPQHE